MDALLQVQNLTINYDNGRCFEIPAVAGVTFDIYEGEAVGLLGESGCGKTTIALSLPRLLPDSANIVQGQVRYRDRELLTLPERDMERIRGEEISLIFSEPSLALNPVMCVGNQIAEVLHAHRSWESRRCRLEAEALLARVHLQDTARIYKAFPHELSGGQNQRVLIAQALACNPSLIIADEPTTSLDVRTQTEILNLFRELKRESRTAFLFISHHPGVLAAVADRLLVMYAGRIVEEGVLLQVYANPLHPYTRGLLQSAPPKPYSSAFGKKRLSPIPGNPPDMATLKPGCPFAPRCPVRMEICAISEPGYTNPGGNRLVRCHAYVN